jgi:hypothetical protein
MGQSMKRFTRQFTWGAILLLLWAATALAAYWRWGRILPKFNFISGWALFGVMIFLALYNARKKVMFLRMGSSEAWLQFHVYAGYFAVLLFLIHVNFHRPTGRFETTLAVLYAVVTISGILGLFLSRTLPRRLTTRGGEVIYERIPALRHSLREQAEAVALGGELKSVIVGDLYVRALSGFFAGPRNFWPHFLESSRPLKAVLGEIEEIRPFVNEQERAALENLATLVRRKDGLDYHRSLQIALKLWLFVHLPLTYSLMLFSLAHIVIVYAFSSGAG